MATRKIEIDSCLIDTEKYEVCVRQCFRGLKLTDRIIAIEKFYPKALRLLEVACSQVIKDLLKAQNITYKENDSESYKLALNRLKLANKRIVISGVGTDNLKMIERRYNNTTFINDGEDTIYAKQIIEVRKYG